jgi:hypothetical protein
MGQEIMLQPTSLGGPFSPPCFPLVTKLHLPTVRPGFVPRPRLMQQLDRGLEGKLTLVSAPAGFGKTTLLSQWCHATRSAPLAREEVAWLSLDSDDNDPVQSADCRAVVDLASHGEVARRQHLQQAVGREPHTGRRPRQGAEPSPSIPLPDVVNPSSPGRNYPFVRSLPGHFAVYWVQKPRHR